MTQPGKENQRRLFDAGLQPERTELAWRRTMLAIAAGSLFSDRILAPLIGVWAFAAALVGLGLAIICWIKSDLRARRIKRILLGSGEELPGSSLLLAVALAITAGAIIGLVYVLSHQLA